MKKKIKWLLVILFALEIILYPLYRSYYIVGISEYKVESDKVDEPIHIVMISDVHDHHCKVKSKIIQTIENIHPDLILCVGDLIDDESKSDEDMIEFMKQLQSITQVYYSLGNHELSYYEGKDYDAYIQAGIIVLDEKYQDIMVNGQSIRIGGLYNYAFALTNGKIDQESMENSDTYQFMHAYTNTDLFKLMLAHRPDSFIFGQGRNWDIDLVVSGHYHGGQVIIPYIGGLYAPDLGYFPGYIFGQYTLNHMKMIITRGISSSSEKLPRYNNPCEIVKITIQ